MKILELRFKNLNSLYGEWIIDFTDPQYVSTGIFALTGPTGAGKSTILDAICLALYGKTPRLDKINKSENEIMSRQTGECYAEVLFESQEGRFRCHWEQRKSRKKADGNLQDYEHTISDANTGKPLETKKSLVPGIIEEKTGMDFDRFTRSVLLAQGGFDSFLKAGEDEKSKILEQLTGSQIYSDISKSVQERHKKEQDALNLLQVEVAGIPLLKQDEEAEMQLELTVKQKQEQELNLINQDTNNALTWLNKIAELQKEISGLATQEISIQATLEAFKAQREKLELARKAASAEVSYTNLNSLRKQQNTELATQKELAEALPQIILSAKQEAELLQEAERFTSQKKQAKEQAGELIKNVRLLDQIIIEGNKSISAKAKSCKETSKNLQETQIILAQEVLKEAENRHKLEGVNNYLLEHQADEWLISNLAGIEEQLNNLATKKQEIEQDEIKLKEINSQLEKALKNFPKLLNQENNQATQIAVSSKSIKAEQASLLALLGDYSLREYRTEKDNLQERKFFLNKIKSLEEERKKLKDQEPCPLCGSLQHPFAQGNIPEFAKIDQAIKLLNDKIAQAEAKEEVLKKYEKEELALKDKLREIEKQKVQAENDRKSLENKLIDLKSSLTKLQSNYAGLQANIALKLQVLNISNSLLELREELLKSLRSRLASWNSKVQEKTALERQIFAIKSEIKSREAVIENQSKELTEKDAELKNLTAEGKRLGIERSDLYGNKNPDIEEKVLQKAVNDAEKNEIEKREKNNELQLKLATTQKQLEALNLTIKPREAELNKSEIDFLLTITEKNFLSEKQFLEALLSHAEMDKLTFEAKRLDDAKTEIRARQEDRNKSLATESAKKMTDKAKEELEEQAKDARTSLDEIKNKIAEFKLKLSENSKTKDRLKEKEKSIKAQQKECSRWTNLYYLIGSADGKKYRNFAQGLTFELMVTQANSQLEKMTDRYLLTRDNKSPLELIVIDNYQAGEMRSTKNLSGGESFIVSLALALGLSKMSSKKVRVDSLFLDEGFGTLDEEALETALESLSGLHQDGKLIGIISHVTALKDRISTQISVNPSSGGRSLVEGPGCKEINK